MHWLEMPDFDGDEELQHRARLLNAMTLTIILLMVCFLPLILLRKNIPTPTKIIDFLILINGLVLRYHLFKGKIRAVSIWIILTCFVFIIAAIASLGTILTPTTATLIFLVIASGFLFDLKGIVLSSIGSSAIVGGFIIAKEMGVFPEQPTTADFTHWALYTLLFALVGALTNYSIRITMRTLEQAKKEVAERAQAEIKLRESEARFRNLFEQTHDAVFLVDLQGHCLAANQRAVDMLGYSIDELLALSTSDIAAEPGRPKEILAQLFAGETVPHLEDAFRSKDGAIFPVELYLELAKDHQGAPQHIQIVARDIRERKKAEEALRAANEQLNKRITEVERLHKDLREQAIRDPLTGLYNRRYLSETLSREIARVGREKTSLSVIITDIDHFKIINDTYGHEAGDCLLVQMARLVKSVTRSSDIVCRYGGEEFVIILPGITIEQAEKRAEEIRLLIENTALQYKDKRLKMTISLGIAAYPDHGAQAEEIIIKADRALYQSKQTGRNRATVWSEALSSLPQTAT